MRRSQSKADKETLLAIQKNVIFDYSLQSLYGTKYQDKALFAFVPLHLWDPNSTQAITLKFYVTDHDGKDYQKKEELIIYTAPYETSKVLGRENVGTSVLEVTGATPGESLYDKVRYQVKGWRDFCLRYYIDEVDNPKNA